MKAVVLAAGKGTRLMSEQAKMPKVLREANGIPLISHVLKTIDFIDPSDTVIVVGYKKEMVIKRLGDAYRYSVQEEQKGTGHAVSCAADQLQNYDGDVLVLYGDMPLFYKETYENLIYRHKESGADCTVLTAVSDDPLPYGRIIRDQNGAFCGVVEDKDCTAEQKAIRELNVGIYVFDCKKLFAALKQLKNDNAQHEYFLTDVPKILMESGCKVDTYSIQGTEQIHGVNTPEDLAFAEKMLKNRE